MYIPVNGKRIFTQGKRIVTGSGPWRLNRVTNVAESMKKSVRGMMPQDYAGLGQTIRGGNLQLNVGLDLEKLRKPRFMKESRHNIRMNL